MKVKEIPFSLFHSIRLRYLGAKSERPRLPVIVSLTSIPSRLSILDIVINSLLDQDKPPKLIILWLNKSLKDKLPKRLTKLQSEFFSIRYCDGTSSYRKLLPTLKEYADDTIVTCDDDMIYPSNWLGHLYHCHLEHPNKIVSQVGRLIKREESSELLPYKSWPFIRYEHTQSNFLAIGYGGVLYPKNTFTHQIFDEQLYMRLCPKADDLWFKTMSFLNGKEVICASEKARPLPIFRSQQVSLNSSNIDEDRNRLQWQSLCDHFPELINI